MSLQSCEQDCEKCDAHFATIYNAQALREKTAKLWPELNNAPILPEYINMRRLSRWWYENGILWRVLRYSSVCFVKRGGATCGDCPELEKCQTVGMIISNNPENLKKMKAENWKDTKKLYLIGGTMGVRKTTFCQILKKKMDKAVFLDGDWCWDADPFLVNDETKKIVMENISFLLMVITIMAAKNISIIIP